MKDFKHLRSFENYENKPELESVNEATARKKKIDYEKKFGKKIEEINALINKAKEDGVYAIETDSTWESVYEFDKVVLMKTKIKTYYTEDYTRKKVDEINLTQDAENEFDETKYLFRWIKKTLKKGYREDGKRQEKERKEDEGED